MLDQSQIVILLVLCLAIVIQGYGLKQSPISTRSRTGSRRCFPHASLNAPHHVLHMSEAESIPPPEVKSGPKILKPSGGTKKISVEKFLMMYTCKLCNGRNAQMISKVAYQRGMVVSTCKSCGKLHLIADNEGKLDMKEYGAKIEDYLQQKGERVVKMTVTPQDLEDNYLVDRNGVLTLVPKLAGEPPADSTIVEYPKPNT